MTSFISLIYCYKLLYLFTAWMSVCVYTCMSVCVHMCTCVHVSVCVCVCVCIYPSAYVEVRVQLAEVHSPIPSCRLQEPNSSCQAR